jgi:hypothetical protein
MLPGLGIIGFPVLQAGGNGLGGLFRPTIDATVIKDVISGGGEPLVRQIGAGKTAGWQIIPVNGGNGQPAGPKLINAYHN